MGTKKKGKPGKKLAQPKSKINLVPGKEYVHEVEGKVIFLALHPCDSIVAICEKDDEPFSTGVSTLSDWIEGSEAAHMIRRALSNYDPYEPTFTESDLKRLRELVDAVHPDTVRLDKLQKRVSKFESHTFENGVDVREILDGYKN